MDFLDGFFSPLQADQIQVEEKIVTKIGPVDNVQTEGAEVELSSEHLGMSSEHYEALLNIAGPVREKGKVDKAIVIEVLMPLCSGRYLELRTLAKLSNRSPDSLRNHYINPLIREGRLESHFPERPNHPNQAYLVKPAGQ